MAKKEKAGLVLCPRESGLLEWVCEHGVGHPFKESAKIIAKKYKHPLKTWMSHGCDGCCSTVEGKRLTNMSLDDVFKYGGKK